MGKKITKIRGHQLFFATPTVWISLFRRNTIEPKYLHKALLISLVSFLVWPLQVLQQLLYKKRIEETDLESKPPIFILGHWRSGTTHLHYILHHDKQFGTLSNYQAFLFNVALLSRSWLKWLLAPLMPPTRPQDNTAFDLNKPAEEEQPFCTMSTRTGMHSWHFPKNNSYFLKYNLFKKIKPAQKKKWQNDYVKCLKNIAFFNNNKQLVLKNPHNTSRVKELLELFPNAKFIFIHRDPFEVFLSTQHLYKKMVSSQYLQDHSADQQKKMIKKYYKTVIGKYLKERNLIPSGNLIELSYHQLLKDPITQTKLIYDKLGLEGFADAEPDIERYLKSIKRYQTNDYGHMGETFAHRIRKQLYFSDLEELQHTKNPRESKRSSTYIYSS